MESLLPAPRASIIVCSRNRPEHVGPCIESVLRNTAPTFELVIVDQSDGHGTEEIARAFSCDPRLRYVRTETRGLSRARNVGIDRSTGPVLIYTDDDCRVPADWVEKTVDVFEKDPQAAMVFGRVVVPEKLLGEGGFAAAFEPEQRIWDGQWPGVREPWGIGANMAFRRDVFAKLGRFDPFLGAGSTSPGAEELDLELRALDAGMRVINARESVVTHLGVREEADVRALCVGYALGMGAAFGKHLRMGSWRCKRACASRFGFVAGAVAKNLLTGVRPTQGSQLVGLLQGAAAAFSRRIDKTARVFAEPR